ncbi:MAG: hypothetical protein FJ225_00625 [Lentisphaerae bacterium]|nr:hypothetical protein [Lentisphaerota bacterium]
MRIDAGRLPRGGLAVRGTEEPAALDLREDAAQPDGPLRYDLTVCLVGREMVVRGRVGARVRFRCGRCGEMFAYEAEEPAFVFTQELSNPGASVDLTPAMREAILLAFPSHPVCRAQCRGLCPQCGANLNAGRCGCRPTEEVRWAALDGLDEGE